MADEPMRDGEIRRNLERLDRALVNLAKSTVTQDAWNRENVHLRAAIDEVDKDCQTRHGASMTAIEKLEKRSQLTVGRIIAILTLLATLLAGWWAAYGAAKGIN